MNGRRGLALAVAAAAVAAAPAPEAGAHGAGAAAGQSGRFQTVLEEAPRISGLQLELLAGRVPAFFVRNATERTLAVRDRHGRPFLRIGPRGVSANIHSAAYRISSGEPAIGARRLRGERWMTLSREPAWGWLEYRGRAQSPADIASAKRPRTVRRWSTPMTLGDRPLRVAGSVRWVPSPAARATKHRPASWPTRGSLLAAALAGMCGVALVHARRTRRSPARLTRGRISARSGPSGSPGRRGR